MKKFTIATILLIAFIYAHSQKLVEDGIDEFTKASIKTTSWELVSMSMKFTAYFRVSKINDNLYFDLKLMNNKVFSIDKDALLMFKLENEEVLELPNLEFAITCTGCGAIGLSGSATPGIKVRYFMTHEQFKKLKTNTVIKIRIYTNSGYLEGDYKPKNYEKLKTTLDLIQ